MIRRVFYVLLTLWAGSLWSVALWVTPILFYVQPDRRLAGILAGRLFTVEAVLGAGVAVLALFLPGRGKFVWGYIAAGLLAFNEWGLRRVVTVARSHLVGGLNFGQWHGISTVLYGLACLAVLKLIWDHNPR